MLIARLDRQHGGHNDGKVRAAVEIDGEGASFWVTNPGLAWDADGWIKPVALVELEPADQFCRIVDLEEAQRALMSGA